jgi:DNA-binding NtrC family response regulator
MKKSVLIVDDEAAARDALARLLAARGFAVRTAADTHEASRELAADPANVVLLDIDLPHVPGDSFAAFLHIRYPKTQIIFMSGQYDMVEPERFGDNALYFRKPLDIEALLDTLASEDTQSTAHSN